MADNYLEKRMEEHMRSAAAAVRRPAPPASRPGRVIVKYPPMRLLVTEGCSPAGRAVIATMRSLLCRVTFTDRDTTAGTTLAQETGAQFHPCAETDEAAARLASTGDPAAYIIETATASLGISITRTSDRRRITSPGGCNGPEALAAWCAYALHPTNSWIWQ